MPEDDKPVVPDTDPGTTCVRAPESLERRLAEIEHDAQNTRRSRRTEGRGRARGNC